MQLAPGRPTKLQVTLNTHSVELSQDMVGVSTLKDDQGREYRPTNWEGSPPGGHHRRGVLLFPTLEGNPGSVALTIRNVSDVPARIFDWKVNR